MRRSVTLALVWLVAAGLATAAAWGGVAIVTSQVTSSRPASFSAAEVEDALGAVEGSTTTTSSPTTTSTTRPTSTTAAAPLTRTVRVTGGVAALQFTPTQVTVLWATPNPGFGYDTEAEGSGIRVEFESESHRSRIDAWWDGGPQFETREDDSASRSAANSGPG